MPARLCRAKWRVFAKPGGFHPDEISEISRHWFGSRRHSDTKGHTRRWPISTLKPELLVPSDYHNISGLQCPWVSYTNSDNKTAERLCFLQTSSGSSNQATSGPPASTRFPDDARGFFYCAPRPGLPALASSVRFRCTPTPEPSSFAAGYDLLLPNGLPWQVLVGQAAMAYPALRAALLHEGFLTPQSVEDWKTRLGEMRGGISAARMLFDLQQRFPVNFSGGLFLHVVSTGTVPQPSALLRLNHIFDSQTGGRAMHPFVGTGHAQFELSPADPNIVHLRIVKLLGPVSRALPEEVPARRLPREGELFHYRPKYDGEPPKPWSFNLRGKGRNTAALRMLVGRFE